MLKVVASFFNHSRATLKNLTSNVFINPIVFSQEKLKIACIFYQIIEERNQRTPKCPTKLSKHSVT